MLLTLPKNLIITVRRYKEDYYGISKDSSTIKFPLKLSLDRYVLKRDVIPNSDGYDFSEIGECNEVPQDLYELYGVIVHHGSMDRGHYTCFVSSTRDRRKEW